MDHKAPILTLQGIGKTFSGVQVLKDISLELFAGEVHCLIGENGAGKSTLIKIISGAYQPDAGGINFLGEAIKNLSPRLAREMGINAIYQEIDLIPSLSAAENIFLGNERLGKDGSIDWKATRQRAADILASIGAHINLEMPVGEMKVAYQQLIAIAKALSLNSRVLILDEPTAVFTGSEVDMLFGIIQRLKAQGLALVYISHHLDEIFRIGDRVSVLRDGMLVRSGMVNEFKKADLVKAMVGRDIDFTHRNGAGTPEGAAEALRVEGLTRRGVVQQVSFTLRQGEILGVAGLVGAGRSELARLLVGADRPEAGRIFLYGQPFQPHSPRHALLNGVGMLPESRKEEGLVLMRTMAENISYGLVEKRARFEWVPWGEVRQAVTAQVGSLHIRPQNTNLQTQFMSGGNQQKVVLARLLAAGCDVLILDEPTRGVDVGARIEIYRLLHQMKEAGKAVLMISSDLPEILTQADRILVMAQGRITGKLSSAEASEEKVLSLALQFESEIIHAKA